MPKPVITVENLSKAYRIGLKEEVPDTLMSAMTGFMKAPLKKFHELRKLDTFRHSGDSEDIYWALKDVSFEVQEGEVLGVIGRNGAGKSTLLKILSRITEPTRGRAVIRGRVSSLLEVGTGFHPELSGRENVYLNGTILGMTKREIDSKFDEIVDFSGVEKFLDTPIKRYSSGMKVRLAFAVAAHLEPEILIIDEVLAVGDAEFQAKCMGKMQDVARGGRTVLFVSHNLAAVLQLCSRTIVLNQGQIEFNGTSKTGVDRYLSVNTGERSEEYSFDTACRPAETNRRAILRSCRLRSNPSNPPWAVGFGEPLVLEVDVDVMSSLKWLELGIAIYKADGTEIVSSLSTDHSTLESIVSGRHRLTVAFPGLRLLPQLYSIAMGLRSERAFEDYVPQGPFLEVLMSPEAARLKADTRRGTIVPEVQVTCSQIS